MEFSGTVRPARRGGWIARGVIIEQRSGQVFETQVGPRQFSDRPDSVAWLKERAVRLGFGKPAIAVLANSIR
jgi:hypothetical protein